MRCGLLSRWAIQSGSSAQGRSGGSGRCGRRWRWVGRRRSRRGRGCRSAHRAGWRCCRGGCGPGCGSSGGCRRTVWRRCRCRGTAGRRPARRARPHRTGPSRWRLVGFGDVGVDDQQPGRSAGDADAVGPVGPGPADPAGVLGGALFPAGVAVPAPRVGPVAAGRGMGGAGGPFRAGHEGEDEPAVLRVVERLPEQGGRGVAHRVTAASCRWPWSAIAARTVARARPAAKTWVAAWSSRSGPGRPRSAGRGCRGPAGR